MASRNEPHSAWRRRALLGSLLVLLVVGGLTTGTSGRVEEAAPEKSGLRAMALCRTGQVAIEPADVGIGDSVRCLPVGHDDVQGSRVDPFYSRIAARLVERISGETPIGRDVRVVCWSRQDWRALSAAFADAGEYWLGWAPDGRATINLSSVACTQLDRIAYAHVSLVLPATGAAVAALAHEAMHVAGFPDEGVANCYAMQLTTVTALALGARQDYADQLETMNVEFIEQNHSGTEYDSPDCYDGGPLDLAPENPQWP